MVIVLCHSRHCFVWPMQQQKLADVIAGLEAAWAFFGGMPKYLVIDNFPAAVRGHRPTASHSHQSAFWSMPSTGGFIPDPARAGHPKDKPKVERKVPYARERFFKGSDCRRLHPRARRRAQMVSGRWPAMRIHGTTHKQPLVIFQDEERHTLLPWDGVPYEITNWRYQHRPSAAVG